MPYIVLSDVKAAAPQLFNQSTSAPPDAAVNAAIATIDRQLTANLASIGYTLPIDPTASPQGYAIVQDIEVHGVIARLINSRAFGIDDPAKYGGTQAQKYYTDRLKALGDPDDPFNLPDVPKGVTEATESYASSIIGGVNVNDPNAEALIIDRDTVF